MIATTIVHQQLSVLPLLKEKLFKMNTNSHREYIRVSSTPENDAGSTSNTYTSADADANTSTTAQQHQHQPTAAAASISPTTTTTTTTTTTSTSTSTATPPSPSRSVTEKITDKVYAAGWVLLAGIVFKYTNSAHVYLIFNTNNDSNNDNTDATQGSSSATSANLVLMQMVMILLGMNTVLFLYLLLYLPYIKGLNDSSAWEMYCPRIIPTITITSICTFALLIRATYPIWGFLSPLIISIEAMGLLFACHFIPIGF